MALDPTLSEQCFKNSIKKYFVDGLFTIDGIFISFESLWKVPTEADNTTKLSEWIVFHYDGMRYGGNVATARIGAWMFTREDEDATNMGILRDKLFERLIDLDMPDGIRRVDLFDLTWTKAGGMMVETGIESKEERGIDKTLYRFINIYFRYGAK